MSGRSTQTTLRIPDSGAVRQARYRATPEKLELPFWANADGSPQLFEVTAPDKRRMLSGLKQLHSDVEFQIARLEGDGVA